jgi:GTPase SAR1 family protein
MNTVKIAIVGAHGVGKSTICKKIQSKLYDKFFEQEKLKINKNSTYGPTEIHYTFQNKFIAIPEQFREIVKDVSNFPKDIKGGDNLSLPFKQTEEITLATYAKQLYLENLYTVQGQNILCDRSVLDTFVYYNYFRGCCYYDNFSIKEDIINTDIICKRSYKTLQFACGYIEKNYSKIYLIEPSDREIESDGFRMTDKKQQLEIHRLFLEYFKDFDNVVIVDQEKQDDIVEMICNDFSV